MLAHAQRREACILKSIFRKFLIDTNQMAAKNLVIVESPGKIKTISKFLGDDYKVMASMGHVRDLPEVKNGN